MMRWLSNNIFAVNRTLRVSASKFNHCSSVCPLHKGTKNPRGTLLAWYSGSGECHDDQSVHVVFIDGSTMTEPLRVGDCTGNPVLVPAEEDAVLLWSKFEDNNQIRRLVDRWKYCSIWVQRIGVRDGGVHLLGTPAQIAGPDQHLLGRCNPLVHDGRVILPLYDEVARECVIFEGEDLHYAETERFGTNMIQPTIWSKGARVCALARNFGANAGKKSRYCESLNGKNWSQPTQSRLWNINNSVQVTTWNGNDVVLWNDTNGRWRRNLTLGVLQYKNDGPGFDWVEAEPVEVVGVQHGSYPSMCVDYDGNLNFSFTNAAREIEYHVWNDKTFRQRRSYSARRTGTRNRRTRVATP